MKFGKRFRILASTSILALGLECGAIGVANAAANPNVKDIVKAYGIENSKPEFSYASKTVTDGVATFTGVKFGEGSTADKMVLSLSPEGQNLDFSFFNVVFKGETPDLAASEISLHLNEKLDLAANKATLPFVNEDMNISGDITIKDMKSISPDGGTMNAKSLFIDDAKLVNGDLKSFKNLQLDGILVGVEGFNVNIGNITLLEPGPELFHELSEKSKTGMAAKSDKDIFDKFSFKQFKLSDVLVKPVAKKTPPAEKADDKSKDKAEETPPAKAEEFIGFSLANFQIDDYNPDKIANFSLNKMNFDAAYHEDPINFKLDEFSFKDLDMRFFKAYLAPYFKSGNEKELVGLRKMKLRELFAGGPLHSGISKFNLAGLSFNGAGAAYSLDRVAVDTIKDAQGIVTNYSMPIGNMNIKVTDGKKPFGMMLAMGLEQLGLNSIDMSFGADANYDVANDKVDFKNSFFKWDKMGQMTFEMELLGQMKWLENTSLGELYDATKYAYKAGGTTKKPVAAKPKTVAKKGKKGTKTAAKAAPAKTTTKAANSETDDLMNVLRLYKGIKVSHMKFEISDLGGLDRVATKEATDKKVNVQKIRADWASAFTKDAVKKDTTPFEKSFLENIGKFIISGGTFYLQMDKPEGLDFVGAIDAKTKPENLGIQFGVKPK